MLSHPKYHLKNIELTVKFFENDYSLESIFNLRLKSFIYNVIKNQEKNEINRKISCQSVIQYKLDHSHEFEIMSRS